MFQRATCCRICGNTNLEPILELGQQALTGVFPRSREQKLTVGPLTLVRCAGEGSQFCNLVQLADSYESSEIYGDNYGYRSGLNRLMVEHLKNKVDELLKIASVEKQDLVLDIGSNDGTTLGFFPDNGPLLVGIDPSAKKFGKYYKPHIHRVPELFSADLFRDKFPGQKPKVVTSIAMFYDLEVPQQFVNDVASILADDGIWHLEQSYLPSMLAVNAYDTVCHEHIEYYSLRQMQFMLQRAKLRIIDVVLNDVNGGSFALTVAKENSPFPSNEATVHECVQREAALGLGTARPFDEFKSRVRRHREELVELVRQLKSQGKKVLGYGASTKGNVILQYCGFTPDDLPAIADVNEDKHGCFTPGTLIPIISEREAHAMQPDYFLVFPWHFRRNLLQREEAFFARGGKMIFPLPRIEIVGRDSIVPVAQLVS